MITLAIFYTESRYNALGRAVSTDKNRIASQLEMILFKIDLSNSLIV